MPGAKPDVHRRLADALSLHRSGQTAHAELVCRDVLKDVPDNAQALGMLGLIEVSKGNRAAAIDLLQRAVDREPDSAPTRFNLGILLQDLRRHEDALAQLEAAAQLRPGAAQAHNACGLSLKALGRFEQALTRYQAALRIEPDHADALNNAGVALRHLGRYDDAVGLLERAAALRPGSAQVHNNLGVALHQLGRHDEAAASFRQAVALDPGFAEAEMNLGVALGELKRFEDSQTVLRRVHHRLPDKVDVLVNLANVLRELGHHDEALALYRRAIDQQPGEADVLMNAGNLLRDVHRFGEALDYYDQALALAGDSADIHWNEALCRLAMGELQRGWAKYEWRRQIASLHDVARRFHSPLWLGDAELAGKTVLVHAEQGLGDTLQFCRYASVLRDRGARVILEVQRPLVELLSGLEGADRVISRGAEDPAADFHCPLLSLPFACRTTLETIPAPTACLRPAPEWVEQWAGVVRREPGPHIGLAWAGNPQHPDDHRRSITLADLLPALPPGVQLWSLQKEISEHDRALIVQSGRVRCFDQNEFVHTAAQIASMDAVIAVDTSIAHLAAAMGKPVWLMLAYTCDWRWMWGRDDSPWYPSVTLLRQKCTADWSGVLARIGERAAALAGSR